MSAAALYYATVMHRRHIKPFYRFTYKVFYLLIDIDRLDEAQAQSRWLACNRRGLVAFNNADHGPKDGAPLRPWAEQMLAEHGIALNGGRIQLLCLPRILGHVFNPISLYYCQDADGAVRAVIAEVHNTFGEQHCYVLDTRNGPLDESQVLTKAKRLHVSPFLDVEGEYQFRLTAPQAGEGSRLRVLIDGFRDGAPITTASLFGQRSAVTSGSLLAAVFRLPLITLQVVFGIHWQALKLWLRGAGYRSKPAPPSAPSS